SGPSLVLGMFTAGVTNRSIVQQDPDYIQMIDHKQGQLNTQVCVLLYPTAGQSTGPSWEIVSGNSSSASAITVAFRAAASSPADPGDPEDPGDPGYIDDPDDVGLDMTAASGWTSVVGGTRLDVISSDSDLAYISTAVNPQDEELTLTLPSIEPPDDELEIPLRLSATAGQAEVVAELYNPGSSSWIPAGKITVSGDQPGYYTAVWQSGSISAVSDSSWRSGLTVRLRVNAGSRPLFHQLTSGGIKPIYLGIVTADGVDVGTVSSSVTVRLYRATVIAVPFSGTAPGPDPEPEAPATIA